MKPKKKAPAKKTTKKLLKEADQRCQVIIKRTKMYDVGGMMMKKYANGGAMKR